ncbi:MAG: PEP-CTERM sorting domain-containing protein [Methylococcaceae bacterium]|nr:PEP-CTERM sorting domain-containing protein [Methylococcaceae bacterium]
MIKKSAYLAAALASALAMQAEASTVNLMADGQWNEFDVDQSISLSSSGLDWIDLNDGAALNFSLTLSSPAILKVVDGGFAGDRFEVLDNGVSLGQTSAAVDTYLADLNMGLNFNAAYADARWSRGEFWLGAGSHSITGHLSASVLNALSQPLNATVGAVSLTRVPVPATWGLLLAGSWMMGAFMRRRSN